MGSLVIGLSQYAFITSNGRTFIVFLGMVQKNSSKGINPLATSTKPLRGSLPYNPEIVIFEPCLFLHVFRKISYAWST
jgi:hypothetical protein